MNKAELSSGFFMRRLPETRSRPEDWLALAILAFALVLAGTARTALNGVIELAGTALLALLVWNGGWTRPMRLAAALCGILFALMLVQIVPLPFDAWAAMPGRETAAQIVRHAGGGGWQAISLAPWTTLGVVPTLLPVAALAIWAAGAGETALRRAAWLVVLVAMASGLLGLFQFAGSDLYLRGNGHNGAATGLFANRNHLASLCAMAIALLPLVAGSSRADRTPWGALLAIAFLLLTVLATTSRAGIALALLASVATAASLLGANRRGKGIPVIGWIAIALVLGGAGFVLLDPQILPIFARFSGGPEDYRFAIWADTLYAARQFLPWGTGFGTFEPVYASVETLETMSFAQVNEAHNEYLQVLLEGGLPFAIAGLAVLIFLGIGLIRALFAGDAGTRAIGIAVLLALLHSVVDFPMRNYAILLGFTVFAARLLAVPGRISGEHGTAVEGSYE